MEITQKFGWVWVTPHANYYFLKITFKNLMMWFVDTKTIDE